MKKKLLVTFFAVALFAGLTIVYATADNKDKGDWFSSSSSKNLKTAVEKKAGHDCCDKDKNGECKLKREKPCDMKGDAVSEK